MFDGFIGELLGRKRGRARGRDLRYTMELTLAEAGLGVSKGIKYPVRIACRRCAGTGADGGDRGTVPCKGCEGRGQVKVVRSGISLTRACGECRGTGRTIVQRCTECQGDGSLRVDKELWVTLPAGIEDGHVKLMKGEGEHGRLGGRSGDLYIVIKVEKHADLVREGDDLYCEIKISFPEAALGANPEVPTLSGKVRMRVPAGTQSGRLFRMRGLGVARPSGLRGDQKVRVIVETPAELTARERELYEELARERNTPVAELPEPPRRGLFSRMRDLLK
jgi:molecular chaperone DnaJ